MTTATKQFTVRPASQRGRTEIGWLHSWHSFSFGRYYDPNNMGYRTLRVINDDIIEPRGGFGEHGHDNMEIITWIINGELRHGDSTGADDVIRPGEVQAMTAGRGIRHSEVNPSATEAVHLIQIWIEPDRANLEPSYRQKKFDQSGRANQWQSIASPDGRADSMVIHQDATLSVAELSTAKRLTASLDAGRHGYLHVAYGAVQVGDTKLTGGDAITFDGETSLGIAASEDSQLLFFDLA
jgi:redox-sensitive bicupin YhaK (pirin superfamily)